MELETFITEWEKTDDTVVILCEQTFSGSSIHISDPLGIIHEEKPEEESVSKVKFISPQGTFSIKGRKRDFVFPPQTTIQGFAFFYVEFSSATEASWQRVEPVNEGVWDEFECDYGNFCFMDADTYNAWIAKAKTYAEPYDDWLCEIIDEEKIANIVENPMGGHLTIITTPGGNGTSGAFLGLDENGAPTKLVIEMIPE